MTENEALVMHYLRTFSGQRVSRTDMLNKLASAKTGYVRNRFHVPKDERRAAWVALRKATDDLIKAKRVIRHRGKQVNGKPGKSTIRLNAAFERNPVL